MRHKHQLQTLTTKYNVLVEELNTLREQYTKHYQNHANTLLFLQGKNKDLHRELTEYKKVLPLPLPIHVPHPKKKKGYENGDFLEEDKKITPMPNVSIIPQPLHPHPILKSKCFTPYPYYYNYLSPSYYDYPYSYHYPYYREGPKPTPTPVHPPGYLPGVPTPKKEFVHFSDSDSDSDNE